MPSSHHNSGGPTIELKWTTDRHAGTTNTGSYLGENLVLSPAPGDSGQCLEPSFAVITGEEELLASRVQETGLWLNSLQHTAHNSELYNLKCK